MAAWTGSGAVAAIASAVLLAAGCSDGDATHSAGPAADPTAAGSTVRAQVLVPDVTGLPDADAARAALAAAGLGVAFSPAPIAPDPNDTCPIRSVPIAQRPDVGTLLARGAVVAVALQVVGSSCPVPLPPESDAMAAIGHAAIALHDRLAPGTYVFPNLLHPPACGATQAARPGRPDERRTMILIACLQDARPEIDGERARLVSLAPAATSFEEARRAAVPRGAIGVYVAGDGRYFGFFLHRRGSTVGYDGSWCCGGVG